MFSLIKQVSVILLSFNSFLARVAKVQTKYLSLNHKPCMSRPTLTDLNPVELKCYLFMISSDKCNGSCNDLSPKICVPKKTKEINFKVFNMITNKYEAKAMAKLISCDCKYKFSSTTYNSNQKWSNKTCECKCYCERKKGYSWNPSTCTCENSKHLKMICYDSKIVYDEIISVIDIVSTKMTNAIATNLSINSYDKKI